MSTIAKFIIQFLFGISRSDGICILGMMSLESLLHNNGNNINRRYINTEGVQFLGRFTILTVGMQYPILG